MKSNIIVFLIAISAGLSGCAVTDVDRSADFSSYRTYSWGDSEQNVSNPMYESDLIAKRIKNAVETEFRKRGILKNNEQPDFIVRYQTYTEEKTRNISPQPYGYRFFPFGFYPYALGYGYPYYWMRGPQVEQFTEGTLILDIVDRRTEEIIWRGAVSGNVEDTSNLKKQVEKGVKAIMKKYPVSPDEPIRIESDPDVIS